jgi:hypothetical protein
MSTLGQDTFFDPTWAEELEDDAMSTIGQDTRYNPTRADELEDEATSATPHPEYVRDILIKISKKYDQDLIMTMTIHDVVSEIPWGPESAALLDEFGMNSKVRIAKYIS